jgi:hypothetical protein
MSLKPVNLDMQRKAIQVGDSIGVTLPSELHIQVNDIVVFKIKSILKVGSTVNPTKD